MKPLLTMGFVRSEKPYEKRIAILPQDMRNIKYLDRLYFEKGYGSDFQIDDNEYIKLGCHMVTRKEALNCDIICDTKIGEASYLNQVSDCKKLFGWIHAGADKKLTDTLLQKEHSCYAWEDLYKDERHVFWKNNQIAGAGGVMNAMQFTGFFPEGLEAGIIGRGDSGAGAFQMLSNLGAHVRQYSRVQEELFIKELPLLDIIVMAIRWDTLRNDYLISSKHRKHMKKGAVIIDISDDADGAIESSISTTIQNPIYYLDDILVYSVCNVPSIYYKSATKDISKEVSLYIDKLIEQIDDTSINNSLIIDNGKILDKHIIHQQKR